MTEQDGSILVVDVGTSGVRAAVVRPDASVVSVHHRQVLPSSPAPGLVEFDASAMAHAALDVARAALAEGGDLGKSARFVDAMPDVSAATAAVYLDVAAIWDATAGQGTPTKLVANLKPLAALGFTATNEGDQEASFLMRLTTR